MRITTLFHCTSAQDGNVDKESCLNTEQPLGISGHRLALASNAGSQKVALQQTPASCLCMSKISGNTDYTQPQTILEAVCMASCDV